MNFLVDFSGLGALGIRHLESLSLFPEEIDIILTDPSPNCIDNAHKLLDSPSLQHVNVVDNSSTAIPDLSIVSTTSLHRRSAVESQILKGCKTFLLEKTLFTSIDDFLWAKNFLSEDSGFSAWVNCARQTYSYYPQLKSYFHHSPKASSYEVIGSRWNLCSNLIHHLDEYLSLLDYNCRSIHFDYSGLDTQVIESKRPGYVEYNGSISAVINDCHNFSAYCNLDTLFSKTVHIQTESLDASFTEPQNIASIRALEHTTADKFVIPFQSKITSDHILSIIRNEKLPLPRLKNIVQPHMIFISSLHNFMLRSTDYSDPDHCRIT